MAIKNGTTKQTISSRLALLASRDGRLELFQKNSFWELIFRDIHSHIIDTCQLISWLAPPFRLIYFSVCNFRCSLTKRSFKEFLISYSVNRPHWFPQGMLCLVFLSLAHQLPQASAPWFPIVQNWPKASPDYLFKIPFQKLPSNSLFKMHLYSYVCEVPCLSFILVLLAV